MHRITPFGNPGVNGYVLLTPAYRSLSRPSSPDSSQASAIDLYSLGHIIFSALSLKPGFSCVPHFLTKQWYNPSLKSFFYFSTYGWRYSRMFPSFLRNFKKHQVCCAYGTQPFWYIVWHTWERNNWLTLDFVQLCEFCKQNSKCKVHIAYFSFS